MDEATFDYHLSNLNYTYNRLGLSEDAIGATLIINYSLKIDVNCVTYAECVSSDGSTTLKTDEQEHTYNTAGAASTPGNYEVTTRLVFTTAGIYTFNVYLKIGSETIVIDTATVEYTADGRIIVS
jgi:hypothetical protein